MKRLEPLTALDIPNTHKGGRLSPAIKAIIKDAVALPVGKFVPWQFGDENEAKSIICSIKNQKHEAFRRGNIVYVATGSSSEKA